MFPRCMVNILNLEKGVVGRSQVSVVTSNAGIKRGEYAHANTHPILIIPFIPPNSFLSSNPYILTPDHFILIGQFIKQGLFISFQHASNMSLVHHRHICKRLFSWYALSHFLATPPGFGIWLLHLFVCCVSYVHYVSFSELHWSCFSDLEPMLEMLVCNFSLSHKSLSFCQMTYYYLT